ncbi:competence type IV pilus assembly protein ComGB [Lederbergia citrea]|uniref:Type II secretion system F family protein n=1 Tax=Lederbergia citrea TaxID=2833581 RepID=A0A942Z519_9BACI|nr:competence type IV pilus assembly protein ComGB [Lederbergia citrea]MBS4176351.1 type II secretion system F family protein [Lederbergia citrea]MBS4222421.1 type II secretion system F family protein [Lederbergia citrea]
MSAGLLSNKKKMNIKEQGLFLVRASDMLNNGFTLLEVLEFLGKLDRKKSEMFQSLIHGLQKGQPIYEVFLSHYFDSQVCAQMFFAEKHGYLSAALQESGKYLMRKDEERKKLLKILQYPIILLIVLIFVAILLKSMLLPRFQLLYGSMGYEPSSGIKLVLHLMQNTPYYFLSISFLIFATIIMTKLIFRKKTALEIAEFYSSLPFIKSFYTLYQTIFLSREWSFLLKSGFSMNEIIAIMETQNFRPLLRETAEELKKMLLLGYSFSDALSNISFIENEMVLIVAHGEQNGRLDNELLYYSNICLQQLEAKTMKILLVVQPIIFSFIGLMVAVIYMSIFFPMFQIIESI